MSRLRRFFLIHKTLFLSLGFLVLFSATVAEATPPSSPYTAGGTLDPQCIPGSTNCTVSAGASYTFSTGLTNTGGTITNNLSTGITGGQSVIGGTASGNNLTLSSTSNATKGKILFGSSGAYDEVNGRIGVGTTSPAYKLDLEGDGTIVASGTVFSGTPPPSLGSGSRLEWIPYYSAFRAGNIFGTGWDQASIGFGSAAFGNSTIASGSTSFAAGEASIASGSASFSVGESNTVNNNFGAALGYQNSITLINNSPNSSNFSMAFGRLNSVNGLANYILGDSNSITGENSEMNDIVAIGDNNVLSGFVDWSIAIGDTNTISSDADYVFGDNNTALSPTSVAIGTQNTVGVDDNMFSSYAFGFNNQSTNSDAVALGNNNVASGEASLAVGSQNTSSGLFSTAIGFHTVAAAYSSTALGLFNLGLSTNAINPVATDPLLEVGNGAYNSGSPILSDALIILQNGQTGINMKANTPTHSLDVGNTSVSGIVARFINSTGTCDINPTATALSCSSDMNLKKNITNIADNSTWSFNNNIAFNNQSVLNELLALNPVNYNWNSEADGTAKHTGFIAQEVQQVFPDLVSQDPNTHLLSLNYIGLIPYTVEAVKEMNVNIIHIDDLTKSNSWRDAILAWFGDSANGIQNFFSKHINSDQDTTRQLCVKDDQGQTCVTRTQLDQLLQGGGSVGSSTPPDATQSPDVTPPPIDSQTPPADTDTQSPDVTPVPVSLDSSNVAG